VSDIKSWANSLLRQPRQSEERYTYMDSSIELTTGADIQELDTVPAELIDMVPPVTPKP
jgi:hypothetical protein